MTGTASGTTPSTPPATPRSTNSLTGPNCGRRGGCWAWLRSVVVGRLDLGGCGGRWAWQVGVVVGWACLRSVWIDIAWAVRPTCSPNSPSLATPRPTGSRAVVPAPNRTFRSRRRLFPGGLSKVVFPQIRWLISAISPGDWHRIRSGAAQRSLAPANKPSSMEDQPIRP